MSAVQIAKEALFGNPPNPAMKPSREGLLAAVAELQRGVAAAALAGTNLDAAAALVAPIAEDAKLARDSAQGALSASEDARDQAVKAEVRANLSADRAQQVLDSSQAIQQAAEAFGQVSEQIGGGRGVVVYDDGAFGVADQELFKGEPGTDGSSVGRVSNIAAVTVPTGTDIIKVSGNTATGDGGAGREFTRDNFASGPLVRADAAGQKFRPSGLRHDMGIWADDFGAKPDGVRTGSLGAINQYTGTDNTAAINAAIAYAYDAGIPNVRLRRGIYVCLGEIITPVSNGGSNFVKAIALRGHCRPTPVFGTINQSNGQPFPLSDDGTIIACQAQSGAAIRVPVASGGNYDPFSIGMLEVSDLEIRTYDNPRCDGIDARNASNLVVERVNVTTGVYNVVASQPAYNTKALRTPQINNAAYLTVTDFLATGFFVGSTVNEHQITTKSNFAGCYIGLEYQVANHASKVIDCAIQRCHWPVYGNLNAPHFADLSQIRIERVGAGQDTPSTQWQRTDVDVYDPGNSLHATLGYHAVLGGVGTVTTFSMTGGKNVSAYQIGSVALAGQFSAFAARPLNAANNAETMLKWNSGSRYDNFLFDTAEPETGKTRIICQASGMYDFALPIFFPANAVGTRQIVVYKNGSDVANIFALSSQASAPTRGVCATAGRSLVPISKGDVLTATVFQDSGADMAINHVIDPSGRFTLNRINSSTF